MQRLVRIRIGLAMDIGIQFWRRTVIQLLLGGLLLASILPAATAKTFSAGLESSRWQQEGDIFQCTLSHPIPGFGVAVFTTRAGEQAAFTLTSWQRPMQKGQADVMREPAHWDQQSEPELLGRVRVKAGPQPLRLSGEVPTRMLETLQRGQHPSIRRLSWFDSREMIDVRLTTVQFRPAYRSFMDCLAGLLPVNFDQIKRSVIYFKSGAVGLTEIDHELLDNIALYIKADPEVAQVIIDGHTDNVGRRLENRELSKERAEEVQAYLKLMGVHESMMLVRFHGERYPVVQNRTAADRDRNRRVTLRLKKKYEVERDRIKAERQAAKMISSVASTTSADNSNDSDKKEESTALENSELKNENEVESDSVEEQKQDQDQADPVATQANNSQNKIEAAVTEAPAAEGR